MSFAITMNTANLRRFQAMEEIACLWAGTLSLWQTAQVHLPKEKVSQLQNQLREFFKNLQEFLCESTVGREEENKLGEIDRFFSNLITTIEVLRDANCQSPEISRFLQWHQQMYLAFEKLAVIKKNRTPKTLRNLVGLALIVGAFLLAPQFAAYGVYGIFVSAIVMFLLIYLIKIQKMLEHPFGEDLDDVSLHFLEKLDKRFS